MPASSMPLRIPIIIAWPMPYISRRRTECHTRRAATFTPVTGPRSVRMPRLNQR
jgi:hypothetical protein